MITDEVFTPLLRRLNQIDVEKTYRQAIEVATDEGREMVREELAAERAPAHLGLAVKVLRQPKLTGAVGILDSDPASDDVLEWEYGAMDGSTPPHQTFSFVADDMADYASADAAERFASQIVGGS